MPRNRSSRATAKVENPCASWEAVDEKIVPDLFIPPDALAVAIPRSCVFFVVSDDAACQEIHFSDLSGVSISATRQLNRFDRGQPLSVFAGKGVGRHISKRAGSGSP
jgi:hypothetical protein